MCQMKGRYVFYVTETTLVNFLCFFVVVIYSEWYYYVLSSTIDILAFILKWHLNAELVYIPIRGKYNGPFDFVMSEVVNQYDGQKKKDNK